MGYFRPLSQTKFINDANLVSYWNLDGNSNDSKSGFNGTDTNISYSASNFGQKADFNGSSSFIALPSYTNFNFTSQITINFWCSFVQSASEFFVDGWNRDGNAGWLMQEDGTNVYFQIYRGGVKTAYTARPANGLHMFTGVYDGATVKIYIDGVAGSNSASTTGSFTAPNDLMTLGCYRYTDGTEQRTAFMGGSLDDVSIFSRGMSAGEVAELYQSQTFGEYLPNSNTKLLLHLNGSSADSSSNSNNGTDTAITYSLANGKFGQGAGFNGTSSTIVSSTSTSLNVGSNFTVSHWVYPTAYTTAAYNTINKLTFGSNGWMIYADNTHIWYFFCYGLTPGYVAMTSTYSLNTWQLITATYDGSHLKIYLDGNLINTANVTGSPSVSTNPLTLGVYTPGAGNYFSGNIDEVIIENTTWTDTQIKKYFTFTKGRFGI